MSNRHALAISAKSEAAQPEMAMFPPQSAIFASIGDFGMCSRIRRYAVAEFATFRRQLAMMNGGGCRVRWPIRYQIFLPFAALVLVAVASIAVTTALLAARRSAEERIDQLHRVESTLADAGFPFTESVLRKMQGLSGLEFVALDDAGKVVTSTFDRPLERTELPGHLPASGPPKRLEQFETVAFAGSDYYAAVLPGKESSGIASLLILVSAGKSAAGRVGRGVASARRRNRHDLFDVGDFSVALGPAVPANRERAFPLRAHRGRSNLPTSTPSVHWTKFTTWFCRPIGCPINWLPCGTASHEPNVSVSCLNWQVVWPTSFATRRPGADGHPTPPAPLSIVHARRKPRCGPAAARPDRRIYPRPAFARAARVAASLGESFVDHRRGDRSALSCRPSAMPMSHWTCDSIPPDLDCPVKSSQNVRAGLLNVVLNAVEAAGSGGRVRLWVDRNERYVRVHIADSGKGPPESIHSTLFEPFVTIETRRGRIGSGSGQNGGRRTGRRSFVGKNRR